MICIDMKLTEKQMKEAYNEVTVGHHDAVQTIVRMRGDKEDYQKLYNKLKGWSS